MSTPPWATEPGLYQVVCGCGSEQFDFVITDFTVAMVCRSCHTPNGQFDRPHGWEPLMAGIPADLPTMGQVAGTPRVVQPFPGGMVQAGWVSDENVPATMAEVNAGLDRAAGMRDTMASSQAEQLARLGPPEASPEHANAVLDGGSWSGRLLALPGDVVNVGLPDGAYTRTIKDPDGRWVYRHNPEGFSHG
jgi:hypothetical protein